MKALLINPAAQNIIEKDISNKEDIVEFIGFDTIQSDPIGNQGDSIFFDENCFLRGTEGRFQIDTLVPIAGNAVIVRSSENGDVFEDVKMDLNDLQTRIKYM